MNSVLYFSQRLETIWNIPSTSNLEVEPLNSAVPSLWTCFSLQNLLQIHHPKQLGNRAL